jgi:predicted phage terminase large subunit-like protein
VQGAAEYTDADEARLTELLRADVGRETLNEYICRVSPRHRPPKHIGPVMDLWQRTRQERVLALVELPPRHAKLVADSTPVLTPIGWRTHGDLRVGDEVYAPDGTATRVRYVTHKDLATLAVRFTDGETIRVNPGHRWRVRDRARHQWRTLETHELVAMGLRYGAKRDGSPRNRFLVETPAPVRGRRVDLPIDPYMFGLWLGDGSTGNGRICGAAGDVDHHIAEARARGYQIGAINVHPTTGVVTFCVLGMKIRGVVGDGKFIPDLYYQADEAQRRELLQGLVDSDGCVDPNGRCRFVNTNRRLIDDVARLVSTMGYRVTIEYRAPRQRAYPFNNCKDAWCVSWTPTDGAQPARLPRKDIRHRAISRMRSIESIEACAPEQGHCIEVEHPSHCYLVGDRLVPTHNTTTGLHGLSWRLSEDPAATNAFATFGDAYAASRSRIARTLYRAGGGELSKDMANLHEWRTPFGGGLLSHGYQGEWTGQGINGVALIDDPFKDRLSAESAVTRENVWEWFTDVLWTRLEEGASVIVQHTRWHEDDLIGRLLDGKFAGYRWERVRLPAICEDTDDLLGRHLGEALWPERVSAEELHAIEVSIGIYGWSSLYQQRPRPRGEKLFNEPGRFAMRGWQPQGERILICCDPAATASTSADHSAIFVLAASGYGRDMKVWIIDGWRGQVTIPNVVRKLREFQLKYWGAPVCVEAVQGFKSVPDMLREHDPALRIIPVIPLGDKFTRAQGVAAAWNAGKVLVPTDAGFSPALLKEARKFTGVNDAEDDQIDALAHGFNTLWSPAPPRAKGGKRARHLPFG